MSALPAVQAWPAAVSRPLRIGSDWCRREQLALSRTPSSRSCWTATAASSPARVNEQLSPLCRRDLYRVRCNFGGFTLWNVILRGRGARGRGRPECGAAVLPRDLSDGDHRPRAAAIMMYGQITQMDYGSDRLLPPTWRSAFPKTDRGPAERPDVSCAMAARPLAAPKNYSPYIYAANVVA